METFRFVMIYRGPGDVEWDCVRLINGFMSGCARGRTRQEAMDNLGRRLAREGRPPFAIEEGPC